MTSGSSPADRSGTRRTGRRTSAEIVDLVHLTPPNRRFVPFAHHRTRVTDDDSNNQTAADRHQPLSILVIIAGALDVLAGILSISMRGDAGLLVELKGTEGEVTGLGSGSDHPRADRHHRRLHAVAGQRVRPHLDPRHRPRSPGRHDLDLRLARQGAVVRGHRLAGHLPARRRPPALRRHRTRLHRFTRTLRWRTSRPDSTGSRRQQPSSA